MPKKAAHKIVVGNWKMNPLTLREAVKLAADVAKNLKTKHTKVVICPPLVYVEKLSRIAKKLAIGGQDIFWEDKGPYTGEVSGEMLHSLGGRFVILGHSERRALGETGIEINKKIKKALSSSLTPIVCVGEKEREHTHEYFNVVKNQIEECLAGIQKNLFPKIMIAYEPVWAISTTKDRKDATPKDSEEMAIFIRKTLSDLSTPQTASKVMILYGGSVNEKDAGDFVRHGGVDGLLAGRASLDAKKFLEIVRVTDAL